LKESIELLHKSLNIEKKIYKENSNQPKIANLYNTIGCVYSLMMNYPSALDFFK